MKNGKEEIKILAERGKGFPCEYNIVESPFAVNLTGST